jgi:hypothetical protein
LGYWYLCCGQAIALLRVLRIDISWHEDMQGWLNTVVDERGRGSVILELFKIVMGCE